MRYRLNPFTGLFDAVNVVPPDYVSNVADTATIDLDVTLGVLTANLIGFGTLDTDDLNEGTTNQYFTNERAQDAVGNNLLDTATVNLTYNDATGQISADVIPSAIDHGSLAGLGDDDHLQYHTDARALTWLGTRSTTDLAEGTNLYFTDERAQDAVGLNLLDTSTIDLNYNDGTGQISASIIANSVDNTLLSDMPANTLKGNNTGLSGDPLDLTVTQATAMLNPFVGDTYANPGGGGIKGLVPAPISLDNAKQFFLRAAGAFESPHVRATPEEAVVAGANWSIQSMPAANQWFGACWSPEQGQYVAIASSGTNRVATSPDGVNWTARSAATARVWTKVAWSPALKLYAAVSFDGTLTDAVMTSPDGITWTSRTVPQASQWYDIVWAPALSLFVAVSINGTNRCMTSPDGITWTIQTGLAAAQWYSVTWSEELNLLCAVAITAAGSNYAATSPDGVTWTTRALTTGNTWYSVCWAAELGLFVAVGATGTSRCATSPDGVIWTLKAIQANAWRRVEYSPELRLLVAVSSGGQISTSPNGTTWTARTSPQANQWYECVWSPERGQFIILGITGTNRCLTSRYIGINASPKYIHSIVDTASVDLSVDVTGRLSATVLAAGVDHGTLGGLADDDHPQYHNDARALTWLGTRSTTDLPEGTRLYYLDSRARLALSATSPVLYDNITGIISLGIVPITSGGTGQITQAAALNALTNVAAAANGDFLQKIGGSAVFVTGPRVAEGVNARMGLATLVSGTLTVANTSVTANSRIFLSNQAAGGTVGFHSVANVIPGTSFDLLSSDAGDTSTLAYLIVEAI